MSPSLPGNPGAKRVNVKLFVLCEFEEGMVNKAVSAGMSKKSLSQNYYFIRKIRINKKNKRKFLSICLNKISVSSLDEN